MCLIAFALGQHPDYPLVVAANRDEFHQRPTAAMDWWPEPNILAGRDLQAGGTWLAVTANGRVAAVTNVREGTPEPARLSRGELPLQALASTEAVSTHLAQHGTDYGGFNLVVLGTGGRLDQGWYYSNRDAHPGRQLHRASYGLSNHLLQSPWPKLLRLRQAVMTTLMLAPADDTSGLHQRLIRPLQDQTPAPDHALPDTGVGLATERFLSSPFIVGEHYGTRATTIVTVRRDGEVTVTEQSWRPDGHPNQRRQFCWQREPLI
ncbi:NRDE family protein [Marinobacter xestospongiae]|uniref:NRDE family protein n=1 Tax=Marinobacter xestospongiae TaxID=994319 RepID=UPI0020059332|nr:NRDE family protein [Marinobacter xestospongiae]MCK7567600.1 NRDE family protein [Marinobacter xestospongiae]